MTIKARILTLIVAGVLSLPALSAQAQRFGPTPEQTGYDDYADHTYETAEAYDDLADNAIDPADAADWRKKASDLRIKARLARVRPMVDQGRIEREKARRRKFEYDLWHLWYYSYDSWRKDHLYAANPAKAAVNVAVNSSIRTAVNGAHMIRAPRVPVTAARVATAAPMIRVEVSRSMYYRHN